jgi:hypothetical protein
MQIDKTQPGKTYKVDEINLPPLEQDWNWPGQF